jgi:restriction system protein
MEHPDGLAAKEVLNRLEKAITLTAFEKGTYPKHPNIRRFEKMVRFSTISSVKAGWLIKEKGQWRLTEEGREAYITFKDPEQFAREAARLYHLWRQDQPEDEQAEEIEGSPGAATTLEEAEESAWSDIEEHLSKMSPYDFQDLVAGLMQAMGYHVSWVSPPGPDKGIDIIAHSDPLGIDGRRIKVQVKRRADKIAVDGVRSFMALLGETDVGIFVSTGGFTSDAESEARAQEKRRITLVDLKRLFDLWVEYYDRIPETQKRLFALRAVHYLAPST